MSDKTKYSRSKITAPKRDKAPRGWDMSQERAFLETLLNQRFNFFLVLFSLIIAGAINAKVQIHLQIILTIGTIIIFLFRSLLGRSQEKLDLALDDLFNDETHPATILNRRAKKGGSRRKLVGIYIPLFVSIVIAVGAILAWFNILTTP